MRRSTLQAAWLGCFLVLGTLAGKAVAGGQTEQLAADRPEAWALNYFTSVSLLAGLGTPRGREPGAVEIGVELDWIPKVNKAKRRVGFNGVKEEDFNKAPIFFRPRLTVGLPWRLSLILSYLPPIKVFGVEPNLFAFALERPLYERNPWTVGLRAYGQLGEVEGAFTCWREVVRFPPGTPQNLFGCQKESADTATLRYGGIELSGAYRIERARGLTPYLAVAGNFLDTRFQVDALTFGLRDRRRLSAGTWTFSASAGITYPLTERFSFSVGLFYSPLWVTRPPATSRRNDALFNARALLTLRLR
ncbi:MAG: transporter [Candidatus Binatia bacterium]|nr:transporter [Candidatus Binatia bacterium]